jgi:hypothetical protein
MSENTTEQTIQPAFRLIDIPMRTISLKPGDVLLLEFPEDCRMPENEAWEAFESEIKKTFPHNRVCWVQGVRVSIVQPEEIPVKTAERDEKTGCTHTRLDETTEPIIHYETEPYVTWCGERDAERHNTSVESIVTCPVCLALMRLG